MIALTYVSIATKLMTKQELKDLLILCARKNRGLQITGMLLYKDGRFLQVLEGPDEAVRERYEAIAQDTRHESIIKLFDGPVTQRRFPEWTMGFRDLDEIRADTFSGFAGFLSEEPVGQVFPLDPERANKLLGLFQQKA
jgi:Sensors of blue-light using FAD